VILDETVLRVSLWEQEPVITLGRSIKLVVEVVSTNWETDYARKVEEYASGIPEYWIVDYRGLGGIAFIGKPKQPTFSICQLMGEEYQQAISTGSTDSLSSSAQSPTAWMTFSR